MEKVDDFEHTFRASALGATADQDRAMDDRKSGDSAGVAVWTSPLFEVDDYKQSVCFCEDSSSSEDEFDGARPRRPARAHQLGAQPWPYLPVDDFAKMMAGCRRSFWGEQEEEEDDEEEEE